jgi:hypothetical protein
MTADGDGHGPGVRLPPPLILAVVLAPWRGCWTDLFRCKLGRRWDVPAWS